MSADALEASLALAEALFGSDRDADHRATGALGKLWARLGSGRGSELHVRVGWLAGTEFVQILDYVPSTGRYETSVMVDRRLLDQLLEPLLALHKHAGGTGASLR